jgi:hypothetical protein
MEANEPRPSMADEVARATQRRTRLAIERPAGGGERPWALCLSGGGIRSATFCLGVLQALARPAQPGDKPLLAQFDFVSTVSGGGYVGSFFSSLFVKGRLNGDAAADTDEQAAQRAYQALQDEPPERLHGNTVYDPARPGRAALAWLRDNGRYLTPTGAGDKVYGAAMAIRNWFAMQYVIATVLMPLLALALFLRLGASAAFDWAAQCEGWLFPEGGSGIWWSSSWLVVGAVLLVAGVPLGIGFWFTYPARGETTASKPRPFTLAALAALGLGLVSVFLALIGITHHENPAWGWALLAAGVLALAGVLAFWAVWSMADVPSIAALRVAMTRALSVTLIAAVALGALASAETLAQTAALMQAKWSIVNAGALAGAVTWVTRFVAQRSEKKAAGKASTLPLGVIAGVLGVALWLLVAALLDLILLVLAGGLWPAALGACIVLLLAAWVSGQFLGFLNLSTLQNFYAARLTRAYLGATNHARFKPGSRARSVAEPVDGDNLETTALYASGCAPQHFVNVCVNQTVDPGQQLVQRDRKGKPLVLAPNGFYLDGQAHPIRSPEARNELDARMLVGEWIGVSGAAISTGLGRATTLGTSLLLGFANLRLGRWWPGGVKTDLQPPSLLRRALRTQSYLIDELRCRFRGTRLPYQYLSDGGHFENTAAYEMLRPARQVELLVVCDCGADPHYRFGDLANLVRLARIDHGVELRVNRAAVDEPAFGGVFGTPEHFTRRADGTLPPPSGRCAILLDAWAPQGGVRGAALALAARVVLLKPMLLLGCAADVANYAAQDAAFPQQPTADQFFDEAQWESYRQLGLQVAQRVFPHDTVAQRAFWRALVPP